MNTDYYNTFVRKINNIVNDTDDIFVENMFSDFMKALDQVDGSKIVTWFDLLNELKKLP